MKKNKSIKAGDTVKVISGNFSGKMGKVSKIDKINNFAYLEEIFREKFVKNNDSSRERGTSDKAVANGETPRKKKILIPINVSNIKKCDYEFGNNQDKV